MAIQKYPYKVTKIDWYDYISRGEAGKYYVQIKTDQVSGYGSITGHRMHTIPTDKSNLSFTILDTEPYIYNDLSESGYTKKVIDVKSLKWPEEEEHENN